MRDGAKRRPRKFIYKLTRSAGQNAATRSAKPGRGHPSKWKRGAKIEKGRWTRPHRRQANGRSIDGSDTATAQRAAAGIFAPMYAQNRPRVPIWNNENKIFLDGVCIYVYICVCWCNGTPHNKTRLHKCYLHGLIMVPFCRLLFVGIVQNLTLSVIFVIVYLTMI